MESVKDDNNWGTILDVINNHDSLPYYLSLYNSLSNKYDNENEGITKEKYKNDLKNLEEYILFITKMKNKINI